MDRAEHALGRSGAAAEQVPLAGDGSSAAREQGWHTRIDPLVDRLSTSARDLARQGKDLASNAGHKAQESLHHYADATTRYISHKPVQSVLIAAGVGAAFALLLAASRKRH